MFWLGFICKLERHNVPMILGESYCDVLGSGIIIILDTVCVYIYIYT